MLDKEKVECTCGCGIDECDCGCESECHDDCGCGCHEHDHDHDCGCGCGCGCEDEYQIIKLINEEGEEIEYVLVAEFPVKENTYVCLIRAEEFFAEDTAGDDSGYYGSEEGLFFRLDPSDKDPEIYDVVGLDDEKELEAVYKEFGKLFGEDTLRLM